jgi:hypothetical protein
MDRLSPRLVALLALLLAARVEALVIDNTTTLNTLAPLNGAPWANVGSIGGASGVYLQNGWVITAKHVVGNNTSVTINFGGNNFSNINAITTLTNPDSSASDLVMFNIGTNPGAVSIGIVSARPSVSNELTMIGFGRQRSGGLTTITHTSGSANGYAQTGSGAKSWGNEYRDFGANFTFSGPDLNPTIGYTTTFSATGSSNSTQAATGDSGGGVFVQNAGVWYLAGTMNAIGTYSGQTANTAAAGNITAIADLASYSTQINNLLAIPEPQTLFLAAIAVLLLLGLAQRKRTKV